MKNLIRIPMIMALSALCCRAGHAQEFYRGEMFVTGQQFSLADGQLYEVKKLRKKDVAKIPLQA